MLLRPDSCASQPLWCTVSQFHCLRKVNRGRSCNQAFYRQLVEPRVNLARWVSIPRKSFFRQEQGVYPCLWQTCSAQNSGREASPVQAGDLAQNLCRRACQTAPVTPTLPVPLRMICPPPKRGLCKCSKSLNLFHILTYEGILLHHFPQ